MSFLIGLIFFGVFAVLAYLSFPSMKENVTARAYRWAIEHDLKIEKSEDVKIEFFTPTVAEFRAKDPHGKILVTTIDVGGFFRGTYRKVPKVVSQTTLEA